MKAHGWSLHLIRDTLGPVTGSQYHSVLIWTLMRNINVMWNVLSSCPVAGRRGRWDGNKWRFSKLEIMKVIIKTKKPMLSQLSCRWSSPLSCRHSIFPVSGEICIKIPVWRPVCFYRVWLNIVSLDFMLISGSLIRWRHVLPKELG